MGNNLTRLRGKHQLTQTELAKLTHKTKQTFSASEKGKCSYELAKEVAEVLNENVFAVLGSDALVALPETEEDKEFLINMIKEL